MNFTGKIVHGAGRGKLLGYPTLNLDRCPETLAFGVYAVWVCFHGERHKGAMNFGPRPTFGEELAVAEIFLLDVQSAVVAGLYGETVEVEVVQRVRAVQKFTSSKELIDQIQKDVDMIEILLNSSEGGFSD